jgi:hypothetical protein
MRAEGYRIPHMRHVDVYADLYMQLNFMKFRILVCILNINIYNPSLTLNKYKRWCDGLAHGLHLRGMGFESHLSQCIFF